MKKTEKIYDKVKQNSILLLIELVLVILMLNSGNELMTVVIPIVLCEIIPRIYAFDKTRYKDVTEKNEDVKSNVEVINEDSAIVTMLLLYVSLLAGHSVLSFYEDPALTQILGIFFGSIVLFIFLIIFMEYLSNKFYTSKEKNSEE
ncbi:hypothetical protein [Vagococcus xieshaowenii]|uniref:Uncharacterized protein n=1 Tax=Vagococcus xieshaowenii TaxID=2562451 RepID=A0AAJ5EFT2_9ENTE|nr:hypothetical protein [Vagococcus xieshaowenii]QCA29709.1 hypothetical protein E4Z98_10000 [Vagococcus xieshaowenii]TFZ42924.1 hypothetical protein E4031_01435 [Vagococcus xieshaowenii]